MKKIILIFILLFSIFFIWSISFAVSDCIYDEGNPDIWSQLDNCLTWTALIDGSDVKIEGWFKTSILSIVEKIGIFLSIIAVGSIVYWAFMLTISTWEDEKIKKWKDIVKWWIFWFLAVISAGWLIAVVVNLIYSFSL